MGSCYSTIFLLQTSNKFGIEHLRVNKIVSASIVKRRILPSSQEGSVTMSIQ